MKLELIILAVTGFLVANTYYDGKYTKYLQVNKKYIKIATYIFVALSFYLFTKKHPNHSNNMLQYANGVIKHLPIDKNTADVITPFFDITSNHFAQRNMGADQMYPQGGGRGGNPGYGQSGMTPQQKRMMNSGKINKTKRSVSETKKKFVAAQQNWTCAGCNEQLPAWFEVDHKIRLDNGGSNHIDNLEALCRNCHGRKTAMENL